LSFGVGGVVAGLWVGSARVAAIDRGAADLIAGRPVTAVGHVVAVPRRDRGVVRFPIATPDGRLVIEAREPAGELPIGRFVRARGVIADPEPWRKDDLERLGVRDVLAARSLTTTERRRGGIAGALDSIRKRAEGALEQGTEPEAANLLRGFVLGQDDRIDDATVDEFRRSGLAHLLAVSGQNVVLLALLAGVVLAVLDVGLRARLAWVLALIAVYVPVAGAGPSIQRAGVMGAAGILAVLVSRPRSHWYALLVAAAVTLAINPRASGDVGWQLSFAAVIGIALWARPIAGLLAPRGANGWRAGIGEAAAVTVAATLATAPLMAHHFETVSLVTLVANLLALPAVAPVMWLGMLAAAAGQLSWVPVEPLTWLAGLLAAYIAQIAAWLATPSWAEAGVSLSGPGLIAAYLGLVATIALALRWARRRRALRIPPPTRAARPDEDARASPARHRPRIRWIPRVALGALAVFLAVATALGLGSPPPGRDAATGLRLTMLDVGQGDSILLEPAGADPVLVDAGEAGADVAEQLRDRGIERLSAVVVTHAQADHSGGVPDVLEQLPAGRLIAGAHDRRLAATAAAAGVRMLRVASGDTLRTGPLRLDVIWPPRELLAFPAQADDPNRLSLVVLARWGGFTALLTGDAEAEAIRIDPGAVDVVKIAHHGSADAGLGALLERSSPALAVISVGGDNPHGHPAPATLGELREHRVPTLRTDEAGEITIEVSRGRWAVG
jgi:competence protein ComEC